MSSKCYMLVVLVAVGLSCCHGVESEAINWEDTEQNSNSIDLSKLALLRDPAVINNILEVFLQSRGTNTQQVFQKVIAANGNLEEVFKILNSELKAEIYRIDGEYLKIDPVNYKTLIRDVAQIGIRILFSEDPAIRSILEETINKNIEAQLVEIPPIPLDVARMMFDVNSLNRRKRNVQPGEEFDFGQVISDLLTNIFQNQLSSIIGSLLDTVTLLLQGLITQTPPTNAIESIFVSAKNILIQTLIQIVSVIRQTITVSTGVGSTPELVRSKREVTTDPTVIEEASGLLDRLIRPIINLLAPLLGPINSLLKSLSSTVLSKITPVIGNIIATRVGALIIAIIDLLIPATTV